MRFRILPFFLLFQSVCVVSIAQNAQAYFQKGEASLANKDYASAAASYASGLRAEMAKPPIWGNRYVQTASLWAAAGSADSAFAYLDMAASQPTTGRFDVHQAENSTRFNSLRADKRWAPAMKKLRARAEQNGFPQKEHVYGRKDGVALTMIEIRPKVKSNQRAIVYVVSGSWFSSYNGIEVNTAIVKQYLDRGYTVFAVVHGSNPRYAIPDAIADMKRSVRYIRYHAASFSIDPNKIGITGGSAGGHLSLCVALSDDKPDAEALDPVDRVSSRVQAAAVLYPPTDVMNWGGPGFSVVNAKEFAKARAAWGAIDFREWNDKFKTYDEISDTARRNAIGKEISPATHVSSDDPPVYIIHGDADRVVPLQQSKLIVNLFEKAGVRNRFVIRKGADHAVEDMLEEYKDFVPWFDQWLK